MSSIARPPDPCLIAIILVVHSRGRPHFVFHYPPNPLSENALRTSLKSRRSSRPKAGQGPVGSDSSSSSESSSSSDDDDEEGHTSTSALSGKGLDERERTVLASSSSGGGDSQRAGSLGSGRGSLKKRSLNSDVDDDHGALSDKQGDGTGEGSRPPWETLLGLPADAWEKFLSPSRAWHKRRFEAGINDLAFVGWPVFVRDDGTWRKQKRKKKNKPRAEWEGGELGHNENSHNVHHDEDDEDDRDGNTMVASALREALDADKQAAAEASKASTGPTDDDKDAMTMFNIVFVLDPPLLEYSVRVKEIYDNIIKKFAKALKWEQARTNYVWTETQQILHIKENAKEKKSSMNQLYSELIARSSLARAIYTVFSSISASKIASVSLNKHVSISLQIPPLTSTSYLPGPTDKAYPGLWLTTADSVSPSDDSGADPNAAPHNVVAKHFALLLLDNEATILKDIEASGGALAPALAHYIRCSKPTKSFAQISVSSSIPLPTIQMLASHLVYWRRARAIPPIRQRDTYIVSPNCDLSKLEAATVTYGLAFPTLPSLPKMLSALSGTPRPYGSFIPSKDHKETYFAILAWLLRGGWVTQLRSFARVKVSPEIKIAVERALRQEEAEKYLVKSEQESTSEDHYGNDNDSNDKFGDYDDASSSSSSSLASHGSGYEASDLDNQGHESDGDLELRRKPPRSLLDKNVLLDVSSLILTPHRATPLESRWLDEIMSRFPDHPRSSNPEAQSEAADAEDAGLHNSLKIYWPAFIKYFNGTDALEKIPVRENIKRKVVWQVLTRLGMVTGQAGSIEPDAREQVLVGVRHW